MIDRRLSEGIAHEVVWPRCLLTLQRRLLIVVTAGYRSSQAWPIRGQAISCGEEQETHNAAISSRVHSCAVVRINNVWLAEDVHSWFETSGRYRGLIWSAMQKAEVFEERSLSVLSFYVAFCLSFLFERLILLVVSLCSPFVRYVFEGRCRLSKLVENRTCSKFSHIPFRCLNVTALLSVSASHVHSCLCEPTTL